jgi:hypothetical protein
MCTPFIRVARLAAVRVIMLRRRHHPFAALALLLASLAPTPVQAQVATDVLVQLEMLDTTPDDLMRLATTYADALRDWKSAKLSIDTVEALRPSAVVTNLEVQIAKVNMEASDAKLLILRAIVEKQLAAARNKLEIVRSLEKLETVLGNAENGQPAERNYIRANDEATIRILEMILNLK